MFLHLRKNEVTFKAKETRRRHSDKLQYGNDKAKMLELPDPLLCLETQH